MPEPRWDDLRLFLIAAESGSFSSAARRLRIEQSTVSRRIASLEDCLGAALFLRSRGGLVLTEQGEAVRPLATEARDRIRELAQVAEPAVRGRVRLAITESMAVHGLIARLPDLYAAHPALQLELITGVTVSDLTRREADLAVRFVAPQRGDLVSRRVAELATGLWVHRDLEQVAVDELPWVELDLGSVPAPETDWVRAHRTRPPRLVCNSYLGVLAALRHGLGASVLTDVLGQQFPELVRLPVPIGIRLPVYLVGHAASRHTPRVGAVWSFLETWAGTGWLGLAVR